MQNVGYYNGKMGALEEMTVPMLDRAMFFGDGCYDATMFANNIAFALDEHMDRFYDSCRALEIDFDMSREALTPSCRNVSMRMKTPMASCTGSAPAAPGRAATPFRPRT